MFWIVRRLPLVMRLLLVWLWNDCFYVKRRANGSGSSLSCSWKRRSPPVQPCGRYFVDGLPGPEVANRFGHTVGSLYQLVHEFRQQPDRQFFAEPQRLTTKRKMPFSSGSSSSASRINPSTTSAKLSKNEGCSRSAVAVSQVLRSGLCQIAARCRDDERPAQTKPTIAESCGRSCFESRTASIADQVWRAVSAPSSGTGRDGFRPVDRSV